MYANKYNNNKITSKIKMQNKGIVKFIAVLLILVCCFYLSFSFVTRVRQPPWVSRLVRSTSIQSTMRRCIWASTH